MGSEASVCLLILFIIFTAVVIISALLYGIGRMARRIRNLDRKADAKNLAVRANRQYMRRTLGNES